MTIANWSTSESFWLDVTNAVLGIATLAALFSILGAVVVESYGRMKKRNAGNQNWTIDDVAR
jgi:hypothetical protein